MKKLITLILASVVLSTCQPVYAFECPPPMPVEQMTRIVECDDTPMTYAVQIYTVVGDWFTLWDCGLTKDKAEEFKAGSVDFDKRRCPPQPKDPPVVVE